MFPPVRVSFIQLRECQQSGYNQHFSKWAFTYVPEYLVLAGESMFIPMMEPLPYCPVKILRSAGGSLVYGSASHCANAGLPSVAKKSGFATVGNLPPTSVGVHRGRIKLSKMSLNMGDKRLLIKQTARMLGHYQQHNNLAMRKMLIYH